MLLVLELDVADLAATRFAISRLSETLRAVQLLGDRETPAVNAPWVRWARSNWTARSVSLSREIANLVAARSATSSSSTSSMLFTLPGSAHMREDLAPG